MKTFTFHFLLLFLCSGVCLQLQAQNNAAIKLGKVAEVRASFEAKTKILKSKSFKTQISQKVPGQQVLVLNLKHSKKEGKATSYYGNVQHQKNSNFHLKIDGDKVSGFIVLRDQKKYYDYSVTANGTVALTEKDIDKMICVNYAESPVPTTSAAQTPVSAASVPLLESLPGAEAVVFLDFDGATLTNTYWNYYSNGEPIVAAPAALDAQEIEEVWRLMSEDFRPFALNVTTNEAAYNRAPANRRTRVIFTPTNYFYPNAGGAAYVGSFTWGTPEMETPAFVWNSGGKYAGDAGSHEVGHTLNLSHDGRGYPYYEEYYEGQDSWAPIMGVGYYVSEVQWSNGDYPYANNFEDDLYTITTFNGFDYRQDDHGNTASNATAIKMDKAGNVLPTVNKGVITTQTDTDMFSFKTSGGMVRLQVYASDDHRNLNLGITLRDAAGKIIVTSDGSINQMFKAGTYYLEVDGVLGNSGAYTDYGSLGEYFISGYIPAKTSPVVAITSPTNGQKITIPQNPIKIVAAASDADGKIAKVEFFNGNKKIGEDFTAPYTLSWRQPHIGKYAITAIATDNTGDKTTSVVVQVEVVKPGKGNMASVPSKSKSKTKNKSKSKSIVGEELAELKVYPNPIKSEQLLKVDLPATYADVTIIVYDLGTGKKVSTQAFRNAQALQVDVSMLSRGLYGLTIQTADKVWTKKVLVNP